MPKKFDIYSKIFFWAVGNFFRYLCELVLRHQMRVSNYFVNSFYRLAIADGWWGWGEHAHSLSVQLLSRTKLQWTFQQRGQIHSAYFISTPYVLCVSNAPQSQIIVSTASMNFFLNYTWYLFYDKEQSFHIYTVCFNLTGGFYACLSDIRWRVERFL